MDKAMLSIALIPIFLFLVYRFYKKCILNIDEDKTFIEEDAGLYIIGMIVVILLSIIISFI